MNKPSATTRWLKLAVLALFVAVPAAVAISYGVAWFKPPAVVMAQRVPGSRGLSTPFIWPGLRTPKVVKADEADLPDSDSVIGVVVHGKHRAYYAKAMRPITHHVINDLMAEVPVTITYDDRLDVARIYTSEKTGRPLDVELGGYFEGAMVLRIAGRFFRQDTGLYVAAPGLEGEPALSSMPHTRADWKTWRTTYPETDIFLGDDQSREARPAGRAASQ